MAKKYPELTEQACLSCKEKKKMQERRKEITAIKNKLIESRIVPDAHTWTLPWENDAKCQFSKKCDGLSYYSQQCDRECAELSKYLKTLVFKGSDSLLGTVLDRLRNYYPDVCEELEKARSARKE